MNEIETLIQWLITLVSENLYPGVFLAALIETVFPPIPSEAIFSLAGYSILKNNMNTIHVLGVGIVGGCGATTGAFVIYLIAKKIGRIGLVKYLKYVKIKEKTLEKADRWFEKYGDKSVLVGRLMPGIREIVSIPAGIFNMNPIKFLIFTLIGSCIWSITLTSIGYYFGVATIHIF
ncbi:SNARE associated protein [Candidatus Nitrosarchaeum limnium SFB1]|uniref:SNARE associated protein n=1 Tax=Candidatus Nitrosarchaeum limnium SFB1 TaxID=886738 RepID=F3KIY9_9ARCH|nr:SNARE associated protein [Candidatus Nitrosarchaeum limnium SFB1]